MDLVEQKEEKNSLKKDKILRTTAMHMYFSNKFVASEIAMKLDVDINELGIMIFGADKKGQGKNCWFQRKAEMNPQQFLSNYEMIKPMLIKKTERKVLDLIAKAADDIADSPVPLETRDLNNLASSYEKIDKIGRLEEGKATARTIHEQHTFTLRDVVNETADARKKFIVDADFKEIREEDEDE